MGTSKNDIGYGAGKLRVLVETARGTRATGGKKQYDGKVYVINPITNQPYTNQEILNALCQRREERPELAGLIDPWIETIQPRAQVHPQAAYHRSVRAATRDAARQRACRELPPQMQTLCRLVWLPQAESAVRAGSMTVCEYVQCWGVSIFARYGADKAQRLMRVTRTVIIPAIGGMPIADLAPEHQPLRSNAAVKIINRVLNRSASKGTKRSDARTAFEAILTSARSMGATLHMAPSHLARSIQQQKRRNTAIQPGLLADHCTDSQRSGFLAWLYDTRRYQLLLWVACLYSGLTPAEFCPLTLSDFVRMACANGTVVYTVLVTRIIHAAGKRNTAIQVTNPAFPRGAYRRVVMVPWFRAALQLYLTQLQSDDVPIGTLGSRSIAQQGSRRLTPDQVRAAIEDSMAASNCYPTQRLARTQPDGRIVDEAHEAGIRLLRSDARYLFAQVAGLAPQLVDASFGVRLSDEDEAHYLDVLGQDAALRRYVALRRLPMPAFAGQEPDPPQVMVARVENPGDEPGCVKICAPYGYIARIIQDPAQKRSDSSYLGGQP